MPLFDADEGQPKKHVANVKVAVRCRPPLDSELKHNTFEKLGVDSASKEVR